MIGYCRSSGSPCTKDGSGGDKGFGASTPPCLPHSKKETVWHGRLQVKRVTVKGAKRKARETKLRKNCATYSQRGYPTPTRRTDAYPRLSFL